MFTLRDGDYTKYLIKYIENNLSKGYKLDQMKITLGNQGYSRAAIDRAMRIVEANRLKEKPKVMEEKPQIEFVEPVQERKKGFFSKLFRVFKKKAEEPEIVNI